MDNEEVEKQSKGRLSLDEMLVLAESVKKWKACSRDDGSGLFVDCGFETRIYDAKSDWLDITILYQGRKHIFFGDKINKIEIKSTRYGKIPVKFGPQITVEITGYTTDLVGQEITDDKRLVRLYDTLKKDELDRMEAMFLARQINPSHPITSSRH